MMDPLGLLYKYASLFRKMISAKVWSSERSIKELLSLNSEADWDFLTSAMDIVDDGSAAIGHVMKYGLRGPTKYDDLGEKYLRLYGLLSATYIQQQSIGTIYKLMNLPDPKQLRATFETLEIRGLRHKLSSHGTDLLDRATGTQQAFVPLRLNLNDGLSVTYVNYTASSMHHHVDLAAAIDAHVKMMIDVMDSIIEKSMTTIFEKSSKQKAEIASELDDLRIEKAGGWVSKTEAGPKLIVTFVDAESER
ncbi:hypothetical protein IQ16_05106 [Bradyrhizobium huanghuaihaiense]|uniref:Uncharacterized protein n=1 Tax=Bradyrhizobium huanghuaihaiense TaxID=990078 RepID=A0A562R9V3_9BRAD|nr:hypothetical protein [Bradyrhizobium huanghuaihaiense]TWI65851.1 hypothetical protein IQ16_05106 [Bradyrhizobium huanghuaihaiense]